MSDFEYILTSTSGVNLSSALISSNMLQNSMSKVLQQISIAAVKKVPFCLVILKSICFIK